MKAAILSLICLVVITTGCASLQTDRCVIVETSSSGSGAITQAEAVEIFHTAASKAGLVERDTKQDSRTSDFVEYSAEVSGTGSTNQMRLDLIINKNDIEFISTVYGTQQDVVRAEQVAALVRSELDKLGAKYKVSQTHNSIFWGS